MKITVVIPFHNAERTLPDTLESLMRQSLTEVEYLFVDDGSTDHSTSLLKEFVATHPLFAGKHRLIQFEQQRGLASARATGYAASSGDFIISCDADDTMPPHALATLWDTAQQSGADVVISHIRRVYADGITPSFVYPMKSRPHNLNDFPINVCYFSLCNKLIRSSYFRQPDMLPFEGVDCWEDLGTTTRILALKPKIAYIDEPLYNYYSYLSVGVTTTATRSKEQVLADQMRVALLLEHWMVSRGLEKEYDEFLRRLKFISKVKFMRGKGKDVAQWKNNFPEVNKHILSIRMVPFVHRIKFAIISALPTRLGQWLADTL